MLTAIYIWSDLLLASRTLAGNGGAHLKKRDQKIVPLLNCHRITEA